MKLITLTKSSPIFPAIVNQDPAMKSTNIINTIIFQKTCKKYLKKHWKHVRFVQTFPEQQHNKSIRTIMATEKITNNEKNKA